MIFRTSKNLNRFFPCFVTITRLTNGQTNGGTDIICIFISQEAGSQKNKQTRKQQAKNKYIAKEINTIPPWWHSVRPSVSSLDRVCIPCNAVKMTTTTAASAAAANSASPNLLVGSEASLRGTERQGNGERDESNKTGGTRQNTFSP